MEHALLYAKSFALLLEEVQAATDMTNVRSSLLRVRRFSRSYGLTLEWADDRLAVNGLRLQRPLPALVRLSQAMQEHGVAKLVLGTGSLPRELLELAMLLARPRGQHVVLVLGELGEYPGHLSRRLPFRQDDFRHARAQRAMMVHFREAEVFERHVTQLRDRVVGRELASAHLFEELFDGFCVQPEQTTKSTRRTHPRDTENDVKMLYVSALLGGSAAATPSPS